MIQFGNDKIKEIYVGSDKIKEVYYGSEKVWGGNGYWVHKDTGVKTYFGLGDPSIVDGIMSAPSWATNCSEVNIPEGVTSLGDNCFYNCSALTSITLPEGVTSLGDNCFYNTRFISITLPEGLTSLGDGCFSSCGALTSITLPGSVTSIGASCFHSSSVLTLATVLPTIPPTLGAQAFDYTHTSLNIKVKSPYVNAYRAATNWKSYASKISAI